MYIMGILLGAPVVIWTLYNLRPILRRDKIILIPGITEHRENIVPNRSRNPNASWWHREGTRKTPIYQYFLGPLFTISAAGVLVSLCMFGCAWHHYSSHGSSVGELITTNKWWEDPWKESDSLVGRTTKFSVVTQDTTAIKIIVVLAEEVDRKTHKKQVEEFIKGYVAAKPHEDFSIDEITAELIKHMPFEVTSVNLQTDLNESAP